ncbi:hypothetical protein [Glutamicibacter sp. NPDC087583]|uniref:hypothetical protein n=1 Tax=Glutamicibacter sp. NPDC087583 TaxID=3363995 RepID=UPI003805DFDB
MPVPTFEELLGTLRPMVPPADLLAESELQTTVREVSSELASLPEITVDALTEWVDARADAVRVLGLAVGLGQERLINWARHHFNTGGFGVLAREYSREVVELLEAEHNLTRAINQGRGVQYTYSDILVTRAATRSTAKRAASAGRGLEDLLEEIAVDLGLKYSTRGRFTGIAGRTAPYDLAIMDANGRPVVVVGAKAFDSTGSKLTDAVREVEEMAQTRLPTQFVYAAVDGIGWKGRQSDFRRLHALWAESRIDGVYSASTMPEFKDELVKACQRLGLLGA